MNSRKSIISGLLALAVLAVAGRATELPGSDVGGINNPGDLVLGFQNATQSSDVAFDIGQFTAYEGVAPGTYTVGGFSSADLISAFGSDATNGAYGSATMWTVFGGTGAGNGLSKPDSSLWVTSTGAALLRSSNQNYLSSQFDGFVNTMTLGGTGGDTAQSLGKAITLTLGPQLASPYSYFPTQNIETTAAGVTTLQLWELLPVSSGSPAGVDLGYFTLNAGAGTLTFTVIPEPSIFAALLGVVTLGIVAIRRRKQAQLAV